MNTTLKILILFLSLFSLVACNTTTRTRNQPIVKDLNQYIGQTPDVITKKLDLNKIGINVTKQPILKENQLIYTFTRSVTTAIPSGISTPNERGKMIQTQIATTSESIQNPLYCNIFFNIENGVAKSYQLKGRAC